VSGQSSGHAPWTRRIAGSGSGTVAPMLAGCPNDRIMLTARLSQYERRMEEREPE
jgi:hypothetical protein